MKTQYTVTLAMLAGFGLGAVAVQGLHAQAKPPVYQVVEIDMSDPQAYLKDYLPKAQAAIKAAGGKFLAAGGKTTTIEGAPHPGLGWIRTTRRSRRRCRASASRGGHGSRG